MVARTPTAIMAPAGPYSNRSGALRVDRGSRKRLRRIRWRDNTPPGVLLLGAVLVIVLVALVVWTLEHPNAHYH
jgi:hypothetical protein